MRYRWLAPLGVLAVLTVTAGCKKDSQQLIERVNFSISENLETVHVSLLFKNNVQTNIGGAFDLKDYGTLFINPFTSAKPFEIGMDLNVGVLVDPDYAQITPTDTLPNGIPLGLGYSLAEIRSPDPISESFDLYGYVDVTQGRWLGVAAMFKFIDDKSFPQGLTISQGFEPNAEGKPAVIASVFGPTLDGTGAIKRNGGIALLANVRQLIDKARETPAHGGTLYPELGVVLSGPAAKKYRKPAKLNKLQRNLIRSFNTHQ